MQEQANSYAIVVVGGDLNAEVGNNGDGGSGLGKLAQIAEGTTESMAGAMRRIGIVRRHSTSK